MLDWAVQRGVQVAEERLVAVRKEAAANQRVLDAQARSDVVAATLPAAKGRAPEARDTSVVRASQSLPQLPVLRAALQSLAIDLEAGGVEVSE